MQRTLLFGFALLLPHFAAAPALAAGDMLQPNEVQTTGISANPANESGFFLGAGLGFGQARSTDKDTTPGLAMLGKIEPGFQVGRGSWSRLEFSGEFLFGNISFRTKETNAGKVEMPIGFGLLVKAGYGYSLGEKAIAMVKLGVGPMLAKYKAKPLGQTAESDGAVSGLAAMVGWTMVLPMTDVLDGVLGIDWHHYQFNVDDVKINGAKADYDRNVAVNVPQANLGLRVRF